MIALRLAWRLLRRDWRSGEFVLLAASLILTVAAITAVGFFTDRIERGLIRQGGELIAADLAIESSIPPAAAWLAEAHARNLQTSQILTFRSVVMSGDDSQLVAVKAVDDHYPLRGELRVQLTADAPAESRTQGPPAGEVWVEARLLHSLGVRLGTAIQLGQSQLTISGILTYEPDRGGQFAGFAPRLLLALEDVPATGLVTAASRVEYRLLVAGAVREIDDFAQWLAPRLTPESELIDARTTRPALETAIKRATRFLHLAALTTLLVAGAAMALSSRRLVERQTDAIAIMRCLGAPRHLLTRLFLLRLVLFGIIAGLIGCVLGYLAQAGFLWLLADWLNEPLPAASLNPVILGLGTGLLALAGFAVPPLLQLSAVPPVRVLRRELGAPRGSVTIAALSACAALALLLVWQANDAVLAAQLLGGISAAILALAALGGGLVWLARRLSGRLRGIWRLGLAGVARRPGAAILQIVGFGLGILALLLLAIVRLDVLQAWEASLPDTTPNHFLVNIQPHEVAALTDFLTNRGVEFEAMYPMIRARLTAINDQPLDPDQFPDARARRLATREFNLSFAAALPLDNRIQAGAWWSEETTTAQLSLETGIAETLGIALGDTLEFWIGGQPLSAPVTSLRQVQWDNFNVNFFVIGTPASFAQAPATYVTSFYLPPEDGRFVAEVLAEFPALTVLDIDAILNQVRTVIGQGARAIEYVFLFTVLAGLLVMFAGIQASLAERRLEQGVLRTFGARRDQLLRSLIVEFAVTGLLAGLVATLCAQLIGWLVARELFDLAVPLNPGLWLIGILGSALIIGLAGSLGTYRVLGRPVAFA